MTVLAATAWNLNADLIVACVHLGYLRKEWLTLDPTYGRGKWWTKWEPERLVTSDVNPEADTFWHFDFRSMAFVDGAFDAVTFDPPYVCIGGRKTNNLGDFHDRFGLLDTPKTPALLQGLINDGLTECHRVVKPKGFVLVKCGDYISSGKLWIGTHHTLTHALELGFKVQDRLEMIATRRRAQPPRRRQLHAGRNLSTLLILQKAK